MFGIGWTEMLVLGVVALIVIGPKDLPMLMNRMGKALSTVRRMGSEFQREINKASGLDTITDLRKSITEPLKQTAADIRKEFNKPVTGGGVAPSGIIAPKDPKAESVVDEIHAKVGMPAPAEMTSKPVDLIEPVKPARAKTATKAVESPAPVEAIAPAPKKARAPRKTAVAAAASPPDMFAAEPQPAAKRPAAPRKPRPAKPKSEA